MSVPEVPESLLDSISRCDARSIQRTFCSSFLTIEAYNPKIPKTALTAHKRAQHKTGPASLGSTKEGGRRDRCLPTRRRPRPLNKRSLRTRQTMGSGRGGDDDEGLKGNRKGKTAWTFVKNASLLVTVFLFFFTIVLVLDAYKFVSVRVSSQYSQLVKRVELHLTVKPGYGRSNFGYQPYYYFSMPNLRVRNCSARSNTWTRP